MFIHSVVFYAVTKILPPKNGSSTTHQTVRPTEWPTNRPNCTQFTVATCSFFFHPNLWYNFRIEMFTVIIFKRFAICQTNICLNFQFHLQNVHMSPFEYHKQCQWMIKFNTKIAFLQKQPKSNQIQEKKCKVADF